MKKTKTSYLSILGVLTTITVVVWVVLTAIQQFKRTEYPTVPASILSPIDPNLDKVALDALEKKQVMSEEQISLFSNKLQLTKTPEATGSAQGQSP